MSIPRRKLLRSLPALAIGFPFAVNSNQQNANEQLTALGHTLHDDVSLSLLETYARSLALKDADARWQAQMMFHEAQLTRQGGGTMSHKLGYQHKAFVKKQEAKT